jgi:hypothetical protein
MAKAKCQKKEKMNPILSGLITGISLAFSFWLYFKGIQTYALWVMAFGIVFGFLTAVKLFKKE